MTTPNDDGNGTTPGGPSGWHEPRPAELPAPSFWPAVLAAGACFALWGVLTSPWLIAFGLVGVVTAAAGWIRELRDEPQD
jgi:hypothetical protein